MSEWRVIQSGGDVFVEQPEPGVLIYTSKGGYRYQTDTEGTTPLGRPTPQQQAQTDLHDTLTWLAGLTV